MKLFLVLLIALSFGLGAKSQVRFTAHCSGQPTFNTYEELSGGITQTRQVSVNIQGLVWLQALNHWKLTIRLIQDFSYLSSSVGAEYASLQYNSQTNFSQNINPIHFDVKHFPLNKFSETVLVNSEVPLSGIVYRAFSFDLTIQGGTQLLAKPNGSYQSAYEFKLYEVKPNGDVLISAFTTTLGNSAGFVINYIGNVIKNNIVLQNGAEQFNLSFVNASDFVTGKSITKIKGLKVTSIPNYQISLRAASSVLTSATSSATLPVSVLKVALAPNPAIAAVVTNSPLTLSAVNQVIAVRTFLWLPTIEYDLTFFVSPNTPGLYVPAGTYSTFVYFVLTPD